MTWMLRGMTMALAGLIAGAGLTEDLPPAGGRTTVERGSGDDAYAHPAPDLPIRDRLDFSVGDAQIKKLWGPASDTDAASDGLGPLYVANRCDSCHINGGRGLATERDDLRYSLLLRFGRPVDLEAEIDEMEEYLAGTSDPVYGDQLQDRAIEGHRPEGRVTIDYTPRTVEMSGGETVELRDPSYGVADLGYGPLAEGTILAPRVASPLVGLGLLEAIPAKDIRAAADPEDADDDGISGRVQEAIDLRSGARRIGRFGWKAERPTVYDQIVRAYRNDLGVSTEAAPHTSGDCTIAQAKCRAAPGGDRDRRDDPEKQGAENDAWGMRIAVARSALAGVPARAAPLSAQAAHGRKVFRDTGCGACHTPRQRTGESAISPALSGQEIAPFTDMLLHDMGPGLSDDRAVGRASGREWRTAPLWGIGLNAAVTGAEQYLHDGRARSLIEAILWHGGEARPARERVVSMPSADRAALVAYLESL